MRLTLYLQVPNMNQLAASIHSTEQKYLPELYSFLTALFRNTHLPSHNAQHHLRVWLHCRELMIELHNTGYTIDPTLPESALIACLFHDTGLTIDIGEQHGRFGANICRDYFNTHTDKATTNLDAILHAIEAHDDKSVKNDAALTPQGTINLDRLVSTADDLDALGTIGVFRYIEIYLKRGIPDSQLPSKVAANINNRFASLANSYSILPPFVEKQRKRYLKAIDFFDNLAQQIKQQQYNPNSEWEVYRILKGQLVDSTTGIDKTIAFAQQQGLSEYCALFFDQLEQELQITNTITTANASK